MEMESQPCSRRPASLKRIKHLYNVLRLIYVFTIDVVQGMLKDEHRESSDRVGAWVLLSVYKTAIFCMLSLLG